MALTPQDIADTFTAVGVDSPAKFAAFIGDSIKPVQRAAVQALIDAENKDYAAKTKAHNDALTALQAQLNAI